MAPGPGDSKKTETWNSRTAMISQYRSASILAAKKLWTPVTLVHAGAKALAGSLGTLTCLSLLKQKWHADARGTSMKGVTICKDVEQSYRFFVDWITTFLLCMYVPCLYQPHPQIEDRLLYIVQFDSANMHQVCVYIERFSMDKMADDCLWFAPC